MSEQLEVVTAEETPKEISITDDNIARVSIYLEEAELEPYKKYYIEHKRKDAIIRGFRKGKAPIEMIKTLYKDEARDAAKNSLIYDKYMKLLQAYKLQPLAKPTLESVADAMGKIDAKLSVEVLQPLVLGQYLGLELQKYPERSIDDGVKKAMTDIRASYPKLEDTNEPIQNGSVAVVDFVMMVDGKTFEEQRDFKVAIGVGVYFKEFEDAILGLKAEETKEFDISFPDTYSQDTLKGKDAHFRVFVKKVQKVLDYTDEELAVRIGSETAEKMLESLKSEVGARYKDEERFYYENQILGTLLRAHRFNIPTTLLNNEKERIMAEKKDLTPEQVDDIADKFVRTDLICHSIYERHNDINLKPEDFEIKFKELADRAGDSVENIKKKLQSSGKLQSFINYIVNTATINFVISMAEMKEAPAEIIENKEEITTTEVTK